MADLYDPIYLVDGDISNFFTNKDNKNITSEDSNDGRIDINFESFPIAVSTETFPVQANSDSDFVNFQMGESNCEITCDMRARIAHTVFEADSSPR